jgi:hypothetical protein
MHAILPHIGLPQAAGVFVGTDAVYLTHQVLTPTGPRVVTRSSVAASGDERMTAVQELLNTISRRGWLARMPVSFGLSHEDIYFISRPIQSARAEVSPQVLLREALRSTKRSADELVADVVKSVPDKRPVASIAACSREMLQELLNRVDMSHARVARAEPATAALLRAAIKRFPTRRGVTVALRCFLGGNSGVAILTANNQPIVSRRFTMKRGDEGTSIVSTGRALTTVATHCGIESKLGLVVIHGRLDLQRLLVTKEMRKQLGADLEWHAGPELDGEFIADTLAESCFSDQENVFDLSRSIKPKVTLWELLPWRETAVQVGLLAIMLVFFIYRSQQLQHNYTQLAHENSQLMEPSLNQFELQKQKEVLTQKIKAAKGYLDDRIVWTSLSRELAQTLPENVYLTSLQGSGELKAEGRKSSRTRSSLVLQGAVSIPQSGLIPHEVDRLLNRLRDNEVLREVFPDIELSALRRMKRSGSEGAQAMFTVICLPKNAKR